MVCPFCGYDKDKVLESRDAREGRAIRRRRECLSCLRRFTTFEEIEKQPITIAKKDGSRELFSKEKCLRSITIACRKRQISGEILEAVVNRIEIQLLNTGADVSSEEVGNLVLKELFSLDSVAYVRFASVYERFDTLGDFENIIAGVRVEVDGQNQSQPTFPY